MVRGNWDGADSEALFLRDAHAGACRFFDGVLGPGYNALHADHFTSKSAAFAAAAEGAARRRGPYPE